MRAYERFLRYVTYGTQSSETSGAHPSTPSQLQLADLLVRELREMGVSAERDDFSYVYAKIPATPGLEERTAIGFISHLDTSPDAPGDGVKPQLHQNYDGGDLPLGESGLVLRVADFPHLPSLKGRTLITTDGTTLLGADDKAGVAEIMTLAEALTSGRLPHGPVSLSFTPDEEIGEGADRFDVERFGARFAYTVDGDREGGVEYETFNASAASVSVRGLSVHPGSAKDTMINASLAAMEFHALLPACDAPRYTEGYEGFYHLTEMKGDVSEATLSYIIRDHDAARFAMREDTMRRAAALLNERYGEGTVSLSIKEQYRNMAEKILPHEKILEIARRAARDAGVEPFTVPIRGGTDGARLSFMGLPCPNLGTGGYAFHGPYEHTTVEGMDLAAAILSHIVRACAEQNI
ncbi:MAG: peptidase T [Clostridia bacterium]|nr:peptidase T [Clostridia bacterium]